MQSREEVLEKQESLRTEIALSYSFEEKEIYRCVKHMTLFHLETIKALILIGLPLLFFLVCVGIGIFTHNQEFSIFAAAMVAVAVTLSGKVLHRVHRVAKGAAADWKSYLISLKIYPERIIAEILAEQKSSKMEIPLDGTILCKCFNQVIVFFFFAEDQKKEDPMKVFLIPLRCIDKSVRSDVQAMILAGTRSR